MSEKNPKLEAFVTDYLELIAKHGLSIQYDNMSRKPFVGSLVDVFDTNPDSVDVIVKREKKILLKGHKNV